MTKPKPVKPATPEPATPPPQGGDQQQQQQQPPQGDANASPNENAGESGDQVPPASTEPMETEKPDNTGSA